MPSFLWLPLLAITAHLFEEFVWPGGFARWYRAYPPGSTAVVTTRFLVVINAMVVTGVVLYIPLAVVGGAYLLRTGLVSPATALQAIAISAAYAWWSTSQHRRHVVATGTERTQ